VAPPVAQTEVSQETQSTLENDSTVNDRSTSPTQRPASKSLESFLGKTSDALEKMRRIEGRVAADQDLKLSDLLR
jgi:hypothetical protein